MGRLRRYARRIGIVAVCAAGAFAYWWFGLRGMDYETPVELPQSSYGELFDLEGGFTIHVTAEREIRFEGDVVTLDELAARIREPIRAYREGLTDIQTETLPYSATQPILVCVDRRAPFMHAAWVFGILHDQWENNVLVAVRDGVARLAIPVPVWGSLECESRDDRLGEFGVRVELARADDGTLLMDAVNELDGERASPRPMEFAELEGLVRKQRRAIRDAHGSDAIVAFITGDARLPMQMFVRAFDTVRAAGMEYIRWGIWQPHAWVRRKRRLPVPRRPVAAYRGGLCLVQVESSLALPVVPGAEQDRGDDPHDRAEIDLAADGRTLYRGKDADLDELKRIIRRAVEAYEFKMRQEGETGYAPDGSPLLIALVRASKDAPWRAVGGVLDLLQRQRFHDVQFAVSPVADVRYDEAEAAALGVPWKDQLPPPADGFRDNKFPLRLVEDEPDLRLDVREAAGAVTFTVGEHATRDSRELAAWIPKGATVEVAADPAVPFEYVVIAVSRCEAAGYRFVAPE